MNYPICQLQPIIHHAAAFTHNGLAATSWQAGQTAKICVNDLTGNRLKSFSSNQLFKQEPLGLLQ